MEYLNIDWSKAEAKRTAEGLLRLKNALRRSGVQPKSESRLLIATWNLREFGRPRRGAVRLQESIAYIAEVITAFDIVAVQEVRNELGDFKRLLRVLGPEYEHFITDITVGRPGNQERMAFLYDRRRVSFEGFAGQVVLPPTPGGEPADQLARAPFMIGFQAGWLRFVLCTAHIYYGTSVGNDAQRVAEIKELATFLVKRAKDPEAWSGNYVVLGDFNIFKTTDDTYKALTKSGFRVPDRLVGTGSALKGDKCFDQIAFKVEVLEKRLAKAKGGAIDVFSSVYREDDESEYASAMGAPYRGKKGKQRTAHYKQWRTYQMSDHRPLWIELDIDFTRGFLVNRMNGVPLSKRAQARSVSEGA